MSDATKSRPKLNYATLLQSAKPTPRPSFSGWWSYIEFQPDIFSPQRFPIGVVVQADGERLYFKLLEDFKKFDCVYPELFSHSSAKALMTYAYEELHAAIKTKIPLSQVIFDSHVLSMSRPAHTSGADRELTVERLFGEVVAMTPSKAEKNGAFESIDTATARQRVNRKLKEIAGIDFERFVMVDHPGLLIRGEDDDRHYLDLNLLTPKSCGAVTSAVYKTYQSVEMNLLKASLDLKTCRSVRKLESAGLFLLTPDPELLEPREYRRIEDAISEHEWKLERDGFRVVSLQDPAELASEIYNWAKPALV
jgi:hypothetical protein